MTIKLSIKYYAFLCIMLTPLINLMLEILIPFSSSKYALLMLAVMYIFMLSEKLKKREYAEVLINNLILFTLAFVHIIKYGLSILIHIDFFAFIILMLVMMIFHNSEISDEFSAFVLKRKKYVIAVILVFYAVIYLYQIIKLHSIAYIHGPFENSHIFAYYCPVFYAYLIFISDHNDKRIYRSLIRLLKLITIASVLLSAVRSVSLAIAVIVIYDYFRIKSYSKKTVIIALTGAVFVYIIYFTDIINSIPLISKTIEAVSQGSITNGREDFSYYVLESFKSVRYYEKLFGVGMSAVRSRLFKIYNSPIHAHNDIVNILAAFGIFGLASFLYYLIRFSDKTKRFWMLFMLFFLIFFNGMYMYWAFCLLLPVVKATFIKSGKGEGNDKLKIRAEKGNIR